MIRQTTALAAVFAIGLSGAALTQTDAAFSDEKLDAFAEAAVALQEIRAEATARIEAAPTPEAREEAAAEANERMAEAVTEAEGISVDEYNRIVDAAQADPELAERVTMLIVEKSQ